MSGLVHRYRRRDATVFKAGLENTRRRRWKNDDIKQQPDRTSLEGIVQSSKTTTSSALAISSTPLLGVVASTAPLSFSSLYFLPSASMTSF